MKISRNWLQKYFDANIPSADKLGEIFTFHSFEVESIENISKSGDVEEDYVLDVKVLPDRAHYALSHKGVALEVAVNTGMSQKDGYEQPLADDLDKKVLINVQDPDFCKRYIARYISLGNIPSDSPIWLKNALNSIGQRSINPIVDITNYVMYDIGQPLHAFDADKVSGSISIRYAKQGEKITLLDGREIELTSSDSVIADDKGPLVVAGAKGGKRAEIDANTKNIIIESANFHPTMVRKTSTKYDIRSDSSKRFENEISPELAKHGMHNVCKLIQQICTGSKFGPINDNYPKPVSKTTIDYDPKYISERLGVEISDEEIAKILQNLGFIVSGCCTSPPFDRLDIRIQDDLVEEIGRIYGYDKIVGKLPPQIVGEKSPILAIFFTSELIKSKLIELGLSEVSLYSLVEHGHHETLKPLARDKAFARSQLSNGMIDCITRNTVNADLLGLQAIKVFEIGQVFGKDQEKTHLVIGANQIKKIKGYKAENILNEIVAKLSDELGFKIDGTITSDKTGNIKVIEIDLDQVAKNLVDGNSKYSSRDISNLKLDKISDNKYQKFSLYPYIVRDIAVLVPNNIQPENVWSCILDAIEGTNSTDLLKRKDLFDTYTKDDSTSYAWRMVFQSDDRTLTDNEIQTIMDKIYSAIKEKGWTVR